MLRNLRTTFINFALAAILVAGAALPAQAASINLTGFVDYFDTANPWNITDTNLVTGTANWNENLVANNTLGYSLDPSLSLTFNLGSFSFDSTDSNWFFTDLIFGFAGNLLTDISLQNASYTGTPGTGYGIEITGGPVNTFELFADASDLSASVTGELAPVPEPGTFLLLGAGLGGLIYVQRRRKNG